jgi:hypothetical protein
MSEHNTQSPDFDGYVGVERCIEILFPDPKSGIKLRMFRKLQAQGYIPYLKLGRRTLFKPTEVLAALEKRLKRRAVA